MERQGLTPGAFIALLAFLLWAAPGSGAALSAVREESGTSQTGVDRSGEYPRQQTMLRSVRLREVRGRGLLINVWINATGPYVFAVDTGAGATLIRSETLNRAGLTSSTGRKIAIGGLSTRTISGEHATVNSLALGEPTNLLPRPHRVIIVPSLPVGVDGILDPTDAYAPMGYVIDLPKRELEAFDTTTNHLQLGDEPDGGTVVRWLRESDGKRPFVRLGDDRLALIDTGSGFGLAVSYDAIVSGNHRAQVNPVKDLGGGAVQSRRVAPTTVTVGSLVLRNVPTDVVVGAHADAPVILGRDALAPFRITFDPARRLIEIAPSVKN